mgnify:CR=1 FL=1
MLVWIHCTWVEDYDAADDSEFDEDNDDDDDVLPDGIEGQLSQLNDDDDN